ncbi:MAG: glycosyltransferase [Limnothrix sp. RL_2_0]|nr:glycosyltransferase [Limnothrix sp. RL_2_0]
MMQTLASPVLFSPTKLGIDKKLVSILLPNLNNCQFLPARFESILSQSFDHWELIIVDGYSDDGAWELIQKYAQNDIRIKAIQAPREGIYEGLNRCINLAKGEYIYIATSDDTMTNDCLEKMVSALGAYPECDICHCCLTIIDQSGKELTSDWTSLLPAQFFGALLNRPHIRIAPHDAILYCCLNTVYSSLTQLLVRRSIFDKVGLFKSQFGSQGDLEWGIRASLSVQYFTYTLCTSDLATSSQSG